MKAKKSTKPRKSGAKKHKKGLRGAEKLKSAAKGMAEQIAKPAGVLVGLVVASVGSTLLDKVPFLAPAATDDGKLSIKKLAKPLIMVALGGTTVALTYKKTGAAMQFVNGLGYGIAGGGVLSGVKVVTGKSLTEGLGDAGNDKAVLVANYFKSQAEDLAKMLEEKNFTPQLTENSEQSIEGTQWGATQNADESGMVI